MLGQAFFSKANLKRHRCSPMESQTTLNVLHVRNVIQQTQIYRGISEVKKQWSITCRICDQKFPSKAKLNDHLDRRSGKKDILVKYFTVLSDIKLT